MDENGALIRIFNALFLTQSPKPCKLHARTFGRQTRERETDDSSFMRGNERKYWSPSSCPPPMAEREEGHPHAIIPSDRGEVGRQIDRSHTQREKERALPHREYE